MAARKQGKKKYDPGDPSKPGRKKTPGKWKVATFYVDISFANTIDALRLAAGGLPRNTWLRQVCWDYLSREPRPLLPLFQMPSMGHRTTIWFEMPEDLTAVMLEACEAVHIKRPGTFIRRVIMWHLQNQAMANTAASILHEAGDPPPGLPAMVPATIESPDHQPA